MTPWAERTRSTNWHPHHIAERYGLFTIILLGESVLAASTGVQAGFAEGGLGGAFVTIALGGLVLLFALWWLYFLEPSGRGLADNRDRSYLWGYGHYGIFASLAALGAGLEVAVEQTGHHLKVPDVGVAYAVAIPVGAFLLLPTAVGWVGLAAVVAAIAVTVAAVVALTIVAPSD